MKKNRLKKIIFSLRRRREIVLKPAGLGPLALLVFVLFAWVQPVQAEQKTIEIPKGAKIQKLGPGHFKFVLPNQRFIELKGLNPRTGKAGSIELIDPDPPHKPLDGKQVQPHLRRLTPAQTGNLAGHEYVQIDDDIAWLPLSITFQSPESKTEQSPVKPGEVPLAANTTVAPAVVAPALPIRIDSIQLGPEWIPDAAICRELVVKGARTVAGETWAPVTLYFIWNKKIIRTVTIGIGGAAVSFTRVIPIGWTFRPGIYQVKLEFNAKTYTSREFRTETGYRFAR